MFSSFQNFCDMDNFLYLKLKEMPLWPPRDVITSTFQDLYPKPTVIIDSTEIYVEKPSLPDLQQLTFLIIKTILHLKLLKEVILS